MKKLCLPCTEHYLLETYRQDAIGRNRFLHQFVDLLDRLDESTVIALDGNWGSGKSFFVNQAKLILDAHNSFLNVPTNSRTPILNDCKEWWKAYNSSKNKSVNQSHLCIYYDAWKHDSDEDPLLSLIFEIYTTVQNDFSFSELNISPNLLSDLVQINVAISKQCSVSAHPLSFVDKLIKREEAFDGMKKERDLENKINDFFNALLPERGNRLVIIIDELDRCNPVFAVRLLERIKHYFNQDTVTFVFSIDSMELQATIKQYYGSEFNSCRYLDRFFDLRIELPQIDTRDYLNYLGESSLQGTLIPDIIQTYHFQMREITRYIRMLKIAQPGQYYNPTNNVNNRTYSFIHSCITPLIIALKIHNVNLYNDFVNGKDSSPMEIFKTERGVLLVKHYLLDINEVVDTPMLDRYLSDLYNALFVHNSVSQKIDVGNLSIYPDLLTDMYETISLLSRMSMYV